MTWLSRAARWFGFSRLLCLGLLVALVFLRISDPPVLQELRVRVFDLYQVIKPRERTIKPVVIVDIDEKSIKALGQWPWPRTRVADLVTQLTKMGAAVIAFDIIFAEPDRLSPALAAGTLPQSRRRHPKEAVGLAEQRSGHGRRHAPFTRRPRRIRLAVAAARSSEYCGRGGEPGRRPGAISCSLFRACCAIFRCCNRRRPGAVW